MASSGPMRAANRPNPKPAARVMIPTAAAAITLCCVTIVPPTIRVLAMAKTLIVGGTIVTQQSVIAAAAVGIITLAAGFGFGRFAARMGPEEAMERFQLVQAAKLGALESQNRQVSAELEQLRAERGRVSGEKDELLAKVSRLEAEIEAGKEQATAGAG